MLWVEEGMVLQVEKRMVLQIGDNENGNKNGNRDFETAIGRIARSPPTSVLAWPCCAQSRVSR